MNKTLNQAITKQSRPKNKGSKTKDFIKTKNYKKTA